jgi:predicted DNA binding CopG/RHH family protein
LELDKEIDMATDRFHESVEAWEEGKLGRDKKHAEKADAAAEKALDEALGMQMISIRLQKKLIEDLKIIAKHNGIGYQPLIRQLLTRFVTAEFKSMLNEAKAEADLRAGKPVKPSPQKTKKRTRNGWRQSVRWLSFGRI